MTHPSTRILVLGAGIAGLLFTLRLAGKVKNSSVQITLVDESDTFMVRPRLHEFATNQHVSQRSLPKILRASRVQFLQARVISLHPSKRSVMVLDQQQQPHELEYDYLVCGGGATGIETAAQVASVYPQIKVSLVTHGPLGLSWDKSVAEAIRRRLVSLGVQIVEHSKVSAVHAHSVVLEQDRELACDLCIWTAGFVVQPQARLAGLAVNERDQILVDPFLRSVSHPEIYAIGDAASPVEEPGVQHVRGIFFLLTPEDQPRPPYITGWLGSLAREGALRFVVTAMLVQRRLPGLFVWPGKGRYEQAQRQKPTLAHV